MSIFFFIHTLFSALGHMSLSGNNTNVLYFSTICESCNYCKLNFRSSSRDSLIYWIPHLCREFQWITLSNPIPVSFIGWVVIMCSANVPPAAYDELFYKAKTTMTWIHPCIIQHPSELWPCPPKAPWSAWKREAGDASSSWLPCPGVFYPPCPSLPSGCHRASAQKEGFRRSEDLCVIEHWTIVEI